MIRVKEYRFKNKQQHISIKDMLCIFHNLRSDALNSWQKQENCPYKHNGYPKGFTLNQLSESNLKKFKRHEYTISDRLYHYCVSVLVLRMIRGFLRDKPYIKGINLSKIQTFMNKSLEINWYLSRGITYFSSQDYIMKMVWETSKLGLHYITYDDMPKTIEKLIRIYTIGREYLQKLYEYDFQLKTTRMTHFSTIKDHDSLYYKLDWTDNGYDKVIGNKYKHQIRKVIEKPKRALRKLNIRRDEVLYQTLQSTNAVPNSGQANYGHYGTGSSDASMNTTANITAADTSGGLTNPQYFTTFNGERL